MENDARQNVEGLEAKIAPIASVAMKPLEGLDKEKATMASVETEIVEVLKTCIATMSSEATKRTFEGLEKDKTKMASDGNQNCEVLMTEKAAKESDATQTDQGLDKEKAIIAIDATQAVGVLKTDKDTLASEATQTAEVLKTETFTTASEATQTFEGLDKEKATMVSVATKTVEVLKTDISTLASEATQSVECLKTETPPMASVATKTIEVLETEKSLIASDVTPTVKPLYDAQCNVAACLEQAFLSLADHIDVAREVRMMAHAARSQHQMTSSLMKKFIMIAGLIIKTMIPIILDALELQDRRIIINVFSKIIKNAESMKKESEKTQNSYLLLQSEVKKCMGSVIEINNLIEVKSKRLKEELEKEEETDTVAASKIKTLEENNRIEKELESLKEKINQEFAAAEEAGRAYTRNFIGNWFCISGNNERTGNQLDERYRRKQEEQRSVIERLNELKEKENQQLQRKKELSNMQASLYNVESLRQAIIHLENVDGQFKDVIRFWEDTAATLKSWEVNLKEIEIMEYAEQLKKSTRSIEKRCQIFGTIFTNYVKESDSNIIGLYNFLSRSIYHTSDSNRTTTQGALISFV